MNSFIEKGQSYDEQFCIPASLLPSADDCVDVSDRCSQVPTSSLLDLNCFSEFTGKLEQKLRVPVYRPLHCNFYNSYSLICI